MSEEIASEIRVEILRRAQPEDVDSLKRFFREPITLRDLRSPQIDELVRSFYPRVRNDLSLALEVAEELLRSDVFEEASVGIGLLRRMAKELRPEHFEVFDGWVNLNTQKNE